VSLLFVFATEYSNNNFLRLTRYVLTVDPSINTVYQKLTELAAIFGGMLTVAPRKSFDILALYKSDYYYYRAAWNADAV